MNTAPASTPAPNRVFRAALWLTLIVVGVSPLYAAVGYALFGAMGVMSAAAAASVCWLGAILALLSTTALQQQNPVSGLLLGMAFRMGLPLVAGFTLHQLVQPLADAGVIGFVLAYYLLTLAAETLLALRLIANNKPAAKAS